MAEHVIQNCSQNREGEKGRGKGPGGRTPYYYDYD